MAMFSKAETETINRAWHALMARLQSRDSGAAHRLDGCVRMERAARKGPGERAIARALVMIACRMGYRRNAKHIDDVTDMSDGCFLAAGIGAGMARKDDRVREGAGLRRGTEAGDAARETDRWNVLVERGICAVEKIITGE